MHDEHIWRRIHHFEALCQVYAVVHHSGAGQSFGTVKKFPNRPLLELNPFVYNMCNGEEKLHAESAWDIWNLTISSGLEVEDKRQKDAGVNQNFPKNLLLMEHLVNDKG